MQIYFGYSLIYTDIFCVFNLTYAEIFRLFYLMYRIFITSIVFNTSIWRCFVYYLSRVFYLIYGDIFNLLYLIYANVLSIRINTSTCTSISSILFNACRYI
jgi:hypothetical protein